LSQEQEIKIQVAVTRISKRQCNEERGVSKKGVCAPQERIAVKKSRASNYE